MEKLQIFNSIAYGVRFNSISVYLNIKELNYVNKNDYFIIKKQSPFGQILLLSLETIGAYNEYICIHMDLLLEDRALKEYGLGS